MFRDLSAARSFHGVSLHAFRRIQASFAILLRADADGEERARRATTGPVFIANLAWGFCSIWLPAVRASLPQWHGLRRGGLSCDNGLLARRVMLKSRGASALIFM